MRFWFFTLPVKASRSHTKGHWHLQANTTIPTCTAFCMLEKTGGKISVTFSRDLEVLSRRLSWGMCIILINDHFVFSDSLHIYFIGGINHLFSSQQITRGGNFTYHWEAEGCPLLDEGTPDDLQTQTEEKHLKKEHNRKLAPFNSHQKRRN